MTAPARRGPGPAAARGFTLIEVLVALLVMAVIAAIGWQGVDAMARSRDVAAASTARTSRLAAIVAQWQDDLLAVHESALVPAVRADAQSLRLVRRDGDGVRVVVWSVREGVWRRWAGPVVTRAGALRASWLDGLRLLGNEAGQTVLADGVAGWQLYFWRGGAWSNPQSSVGTLAPVAGASAPAAAPIEPPPGGVRLVIDLPEGTLTRDVLLAGDGG